MLEHKNTEKTFSDVMYQWKAIALVSIVMAHSWYSYIENLRLVVFCGRFTKFGVFVFLFLSGYFFTPQKHTFCAFWKRKITTIGVPWIVAAIITYCIRFRIYGFYFDIKEIVNWILGNGSWLYWLTILMFCYLIYWKLYKSNLFCSISVIITILSLMLSMRGILPTNVDTDKWVFTYLNPYLNILNWNGIFALGILAKEGRLVKVVNKFQDTSIIAYLTIGISGIGWMLLSKYDLNYEYWSWGGILAEPLMSIGALAIICRIKNEKINILLTRVGKITLPIYLYHMLIQEQVLKSKEALGNFGYAFLRPVITIGICCVIFWCIDYVTKVISYKLNQFYRMLVGYRG